MLAFPTRLCAGVYLAESAGGLPDHPDHPERDADHGGHGHEPADAVAPVWVRVHVVVLQGLVFDEEEQEDGLQRTHRETWIHHE